MAPGCAEEQNQQHLYTVYIYILKMCLSFAISDYPRETLTIPFFAAGILVTRFAGEEFEASSLDVSTACADVIQNAS